MSGYNHFKNMAGLTAYATSKKVPMARLMVIFSGLLILIGGLGVVLGISVQMSLFLITLFLFFVTIMMHNFWAIQDPQDKMAQKMNFMKNMALFGAALMLFSVPLPWVFKLF